MDAVSTPNLESVARCLTLLKEQSAAVRGMVAVAAASMEPAGASVVAHVVEPNTVADLAARGVALNDASIWLRDHELVHALRDKKDKRGAALPLAVWLNLANHLDRAAPYLDTVDRALLYAFDTPEKLGKVVVRINYSDKIRESGKRKNVNSNFISTGGIIEPRSLNEKKPDGSRRYEPLDK